MSLRMPAEHGAWGMLAVPFLCAATVAGAWNLPLFLFAILVLALFLVRGSMEAQGWKSWSDPAHLTLAGLALACGGALIWVHGREELLWLALGGVVLYVLQAILVEHHSRNRTEKRSLSAELVGVGLLTLTAPGAWIAARGTLEPAGVKIWLLNLLFFMGGVLYVKYKVRGVLAHQSFQGLTERFRFGWPVIAYHTLLAVFLSTWIFLGAGSIAVLIAFTPGIFRAGALLFELGERFPIKRLGWSEVAHSVAFAGLLILAFRLS